MPLDPFLEVIIITLNASRLLRSELRGPRVERMLRLVRERVARVILVRLVEGGIEGLGVEWDDLGWDG